MASTLPVAAQEGMNGIMRWYATQIRQDGERANSYGGTVDFRFTRSATSTMSYLFGLRYATGAQEQPATGPQGMSTLRNEQWEPRLEFRLTPQFLDFSVGARRLHTTDRTDASGTLTRDDDNIYARFNTRFENRPRLLVEYDRRSLDVTEASTSNNDRLFGELSYSGGWWGGSLGRRRSTSDGGTGALDRSVVENLVNASINRLFRDGTLSVFSNYSLNDLNSEDQLPGEVLVPVPRLIRRGLLAQDDTPQGGALASEPGLINGKKSDPTQANIGGGLAGGQTGWNIGAELLTSDPVDQVNVWLSDPMPPDSASRYQWAAFTSRDNLTWTDVPGLISSSYDRFEGKFRLSFQPVSDRYVKVVNLTVDPSLGAFYVSEIEVFGAELRRGTSESSTKTQNAAATVTWTPRETVSATLSGYGNSIRTHPEDGLSTTLKDTSGNLTVSYQPSPVLGGTVSVLGSRRSRPESASESERSYGLTMTALPVKDLDLSVAATWRDLERGADRADSMAYTFRAAALLYRDLSVSADYGESHEESLDAPTRMRQTIRAALDTRPREEIRLNSSLLSERLRTPSLAPPFESQRTVNWNNLLTFRPSSVLFLTLQGIYYHFEQQRGWSRVLQIDWLPFAGGAMQLSADFRSNVPLGGHETKIRSLRLRWNLNRQMFLDLEAARERASSGFQGAEGRSRLTAFFQARL